MKAEGPSFYNQFAHRQTLSLELAAVNPYIQSHHQERRHRLAVPRSPKLESFKPWRVKAASGAVESNGLSMLAAAPVQGQQQLPESRAWVCNIVVKFGRREKPCRCEKDRSRSSKIMIWTGDRLNSSNVV